MWSRKTTPLCCSLCADDGGTADELVDSLLARFTRLHQSKKWFNSKKYNKEFQRNPAKAKERTVWRR